MAGMSPSYGRLGKMLVSKGGEPGPSFGAIVGKITWPKGEISVGHNGR